MVDCCYIQNTNMSSKKWSTVLERKRIHMMCDAICMVEDDAVHSIIIDSSDEDESYIDSHNESDQEFNSNDDVSLSSLSSSSSWSSSSSSSFSSSSSSSISNDSTADEQLQLLLHMMQQQHQCITSNIHDPNIEWGRQR